MPGPRDYTQATRASLAMLSRGRCYAPDCEAPLIVVIGGEPYPDFQIAHIYDANPGGRYKADMSDDDRRSFRNLILLCKPHHDLIDKRHPEQFQADLLLEWKRARETGAMNEELAEVRDDELEVALTEAAIVVQDSVVQLGGQGGAAPGAGGGGGGVLGSGHGGDGGRGGDAIRLDGGPATAPGAGGGGAGTDIPNGYGGEGGGGGDILTAWISADEFESLDITVGQGGTDGRDGGDTVVILRGQDGVERDRLVARGGVAGRSGAAVWDEREGPALAISSMMLANSAEVRDGLINVLGGGWTSVLVPAFPATIVFPLVAIVEALLVGERDTELLIQAVDASGAVRSEQKVQLRLHPQLLPDRLPIAVNLSPVVADAAGVWTIRVESGGVEIATTTVRVQLTDPSLQP